MTFHSVFDVFLGDVFAGVIGRQGATVAFQFDAAYRTLSRRPVLGLYYAEDLRQVRYGNRSVPFWFGHLLPEGRLRDLMDYSLNLREDGEGGVERELELFRAIGADLPGAVRLLPSAESGEIVFDSWAEVAADDAGEEMADLLRFSIAGVGLKMSMLLDGNRFTAPARDVRGNWIVKMPDRTFVDLPQNEFAVMELARAGGIEVPSTRLVPRAEVDAPEHFWSGEHFAYAIERFDRVGERLVHIEDFAQVRNLRPGQAKYSGNFETIARIAFAVGGQEDLDETVRRLVFCYLVGNADAHHKNWSLVYNDGINPRLSPAYDLVSVVAYSELGIDVSPGLRLANRRRYEDVSMADFQRLARKAGSTASVGATARALIERVMDNRAILKELWSDVRFDVERVYQHMEMMARRLA